MQPSDGAAGDLASMRSRTEAAATPRLSSMAISTIIDLTGMSFSRNRKRKNQAGQDGKGRKRLTGDPVEARQEEAHQKAKNAIDAAKEALWAHGPQSQECRDALRLAEELVSIHEALHGRMRGGPHAGGSASAMCPAAGSSDSTVGCAAGSSDSTVGCAAGSSGSTMGCELEAPVQQRALAWHQRRLKRSFQR